MNEGLMLVSNGKLPEDIVSKVKSGQSHRVDYALLSELLNAELFDRSCLSPSWEKFDNHRLRAGMALRAAIEAKRRKVSYVFWWSEALAIPGVFFDAHRASMILHHPMSKSKLRLIKLIQPRLDTIIVWAEYERRLLIELGMSPEKIIATPAPIDTKFYCPANEPTDDGYVFAAGVSHRNYPVLLRAARLLPNVRFKINVSTISDLIDVDVKGSNKLPENVEVDPANTPTTVRELFRRCSFTVVPMGKTTQYSAGCTTVALSQLMQKPVILSGDRPGIGEYLDEMETGFVTPYDDHVALVEMISRLWSDKSMSGQMGVKGRAWALQKFDLDRWVSSVATKVRINSKVAGKKFATI